MRYSVGLLGLATMALLGCSTANGTVTGEDPLHMDPCQPGGANSGSRWQDLYACYFGPSGQASCGSRNGCHGSPDQAGAVGSGGFVCGSTKEACWMGMTAMTGGIVPMGGATNATQTPLYAVLRKSDGACCMPKLSTYVFQAGDLARIRDWIEHGAHDD